MGVTNHSLTEILLQVNSHIIHVWYIYPLLVDLYGKCEGKYTIHGCCGHDIGFLQQFFHLQGLVEYETKLADGTSEVLKGSCWNCFQKSLGFIWTMKNGTLGWLGCILRDEILPSQVGIIWIRIKHEIRIPIKEPVFHGVFFLRENNQPLPTS